MNLLLITADENKHYVLIKDFNRMMYNQTKHKEKKHFCMYCLQNFSTEQILLKHKENCMVVNEKQAIRMPKKGENLVRFKNHQRQMPASFVMYADFEAITEKIHGCEPNKNKSYQKHTSCSYGYKVVCRYNDKYTKPVKIYRGEEQVKMFMGEILKEVQYCEKIIKTKFKKPLKMSSEDEQNFNAAKECHICGKKYTNEDIRVRDHCHITGKCRGSAHEDCNLKLRISSEKFKLPVIFHNLRGHDSHFIMQEIGTIGKEYELYINTVFPIMWRNIWLLC